MKNCIYPPILVTLALKMKKITVFNGIYDVTVTILSVRFKLVKAHLHTKFEQNRPSGYRDIRHFRL